MDFASLALRRKITGNIGALILFLTLALAIDGMIAGGRKDPRAFDLVPGESLTLSDVMPRGAAQLTELRLEPDDPRLAPTLTETYSGFWLGGTMWRANLDIPAGMSLGDHSLVMRYQNGTETTPRQVFNIHVLKDASAVQAASLSLTTRLIGFSAYALAALLLPFALLPMAASYLLSRKIALALRQRGMAEIYRALSTPEGQRIYFSVPPGSTLPLDAEVTVLDEQGDNELGVARVAVAVKGEAEAMMQDGAHIRPGSLASFGRLLDATAD
ncbi:MAG: hypothetical protein AUJ49_10330 [Desulfovibrionaceae bacterium CG1_02_65_16]|nr:MAG: hypothetical protein AUJ49_10330 [Desulfovibrionaceae bacterium CG1_02_65_16]